MEDINQIASFKIQNKLKSISTKEKEAIEMHHLNYQMEGGD